MFVEEVDSTILVGGLEAVTVCSDGQKSKIVTVNHNQDSCKKDNFLVYFCCQSD